MIVQSVCQQAPPSRVHAAARLSRPKCPRCGSVLLVAEQSCFNATGRIDHSWSCDDCGKLFVTTIRLWRR